MWALMLAHVGGGGIWTAVDLYVGLILGPIMGGLSPPARIEFASRFMPKMVLLMPTLVMMTLAAGFQIAINYGNLYPGTVNKPWLIASMVVVGIMAIIALGILEPANIAVLFEMKASARCRGHRASDEAVRLHGRHHGPDADRDTRDHDPGGNAVSATAAGVVRPFERKFPPVVAIGMVALTLAITGGVLVVSQSGSPALLVPSILMGGAIVLEIVAIVMLVTIRPFAWDRFAQVFRWALLAYIARARSSDGR